MKTSELIKILKREGCYKERSGSNHDVWFSPKNGKRFQLPRHGAQEIKTGLLHAILKQAGLK